MIELWNIYLYQPVFNLLIWIYSNWTDQNLGWAIVYLTVLLRGALLPLTVIQHMKQARNESLGEDVMKLQKELHNDEVLKKQEIRKLLKRKKVSPWAKFVSLGIQGLVLLLLYQVFLNGITGEKLFSTLYSSVDFPGKINAMFYGFDLGVRDVIWAAVVGLLLFAENYYHAIKAKRMFQKTDLSYFVLFPLAVFVALWALPMVKSLFVLTSMLFSIIIGLFLSLLIKPIKPKKKTA